MKIAVDIDEVIVKFVEKYMKFVAEKGFKEVFYEDVFDYDVWNVLEIEKSLAFELFNEYNDTEYFKNYDFIDGAKEGIGILNEKHDIYFVTARSKSIIKETCDFIFEEFGILGNKVIFSGDIVGKEKNKDEICRDFGIDLIIEDSGEASFSYAKGGMKVLLLDKPWNRDFSHENIIRCFNWDEILEKLEEICENE